MKRIGTLIAMALGLGGINAPAMGAGYGGSGSGGGSSSGAAFLKIDPSVRGEALGGWNPAASRGAGALGVNPANAMTEGYEFTSGFASLIGNSAYGTLALAGRRSENLTLGAGVTFLQSGSLQGRDAGGARTSDFNARSYSAGLTAAWGTEVFRVGATAKAVREEIGQFKSNTAPAGDVGVGFKTGGIEWGAAALNLGSGIKFQGASESLPTIYSLGAGVPLGGGLTGLAGVEHLAKEGETFASVGVEYQLKPLSLRLGYRNGGMSNLASKGQSGGTQALEGLTGGVGINFKSLRIDYAVSQTAVEYGMSQRAAVTWKWGAGEEESARERPAKRAYRPEPRAAPKAAVRKAAPNVEPPAESSVSTGSRRAYDPQPIQKKKTKKRWVD